MNDDWKLRGAALLSALGLASVLGAAPLSAYPLWGSLEAGPYGVGFRTIFTYDLSRPALTSTGKARGREMPVSVWYPAAAMEYPVHLRLEEYVSLNARELQFDALTPEREAAARSQFLQGPLAQGAAADKLEALLRMETAAVRDAQPAPGRFPLVVFAHAAPVTEGTMCEVLASHGFVVAAVPSKGTFETAYRHELPDVETLIADLEFVIATARALDFVSGDKLGVIGMSAGSVAALGLQIRNTGVAAVVSLDGGIGEERGSYLVTKTPYYDPSRLRVTLLHLYSPDNPNLDFSRLRSWRYSERYLVKLPRMRHGDFLSYGIFERLVSNILGPAPGDTKSGFEWVCRYVRHFLQGSLQGAAESLRFLANPPATNGVPAGLLSVERLPATRPPLSSVEVRTILDREGIDRLLSLYRERKAADPQPIARVAFLDVGKDLLSAKRFALAKGLCGLFVDAFPDSAEAHNAMASAALGLHDDKLAKAHFEQVLRLSSEDPNLDFWSRKKLEDTARRNLGSSR